MNKVQTIVQAIYLILQELGQKTDKMKLVKLLFLSDKYHLLHYGRTITDDSYCAMQHGPVGSIALNVLNYNTAKDYLSNTAIKYIANLIEISSNLKRNITNNPCNFEMLSETDKQAIRYVVLNFGNMSASDLRKYTHDYPEWKQYEQDFKRKITENEPINTDELFSVIDNRMNVDREIIEISKDIYSESYD